MTDSRERLRQLLIQYSYAEGDFVLASGKKSRFYVDVRRTSLLAEGGALLGELILDAVSEAGWSPDAIGGMTLGADPLTTAAAIESFRRGDPLASFLVRKEAKDHGTGKQVERSGDMSDESNVVVLDDTVTTGGSTYKAIEALEREGHTVEGCICVVDRGEGGAEFLAERGYTLKTIFSLEDLGET